jgi:uncharacterized protein
MERNITRHLEEWRTRKDHKVLLLQGARMTGKTRCIQDFGKQFEQFIHIDLSGRKERRIFENKDSFTELLDAIFFLDGNKRKGLKTLVFLDGVQQSVAALKWLPEFLKEAHDIWVVVSSSQSFHSLFPGSKNLPANFEILHLHPYSFGEFLSSLGETNALNSYNEVPFPPNVNERLLRLFHLFTLIGGMPEIVESYSAERELADLQPVYEKIMNEFVGEILKVSLSKKSSDLAKAILQDSFPFASMRFSFNHFGNTEAGSRESLRSFRLLEKILILRLIHPTVSTLLPVQDDPGKSPRLHLLDTGLVNYSSGIQKQIFEANDLLEIFGGQIARNIVAQEILSSGNVMKPDLHFWVRDKAQSTAEVDFVIPYEDLLIPVVLKQGEPGRLRSLHQFMDVAPHPFAVRLWSKPLSIRQSNTIKGKKFFLLSLPYFLAGKIPEHLEGFVKLVKG